MDMRIQGRYFAPGVIGVVLLCLLGAVAVQAGTIQLPKGTKAKLKFPDGLNISSKSVSPGIPIICYLVEPLEVGGITLVEAGAQGTATVAEVQPAKKGGKPGFIKIEFASLDAKGEYRLLTDSKIKLSGTQEKKGKGKKLLSYLFIFGLFIKGSEGVIPTNVVYTAEVAESIVLENGE